MSNLKQLEDGTFVDFSVPTKEGKNGGRVLMTEEDLAKQAQERALSELEKIEYEQNHKYKDLRKKEYPLIGDQLDAIWKQLNYERLQGKDLISEADSLLSKVLEIKSKYPKPQGE